MSKTHFSNRLSTGLIVGLFFPIVVFFVVFFFSSGNQNFSSYFDNILRRDIITHFISICVFPNVFTFLLFNKFDKLYSSRGVLGMTIMWALLVFIIKLG